jgi:hypothetical protein
MPTRSNQGRTMDPGEQSPDDIIIHQLGAAVLLCWHKLPYSARGQILTQAEDMIGIPHVPGIRDKIRRLALRRAPRT